MEKKYYIYDDGEGQKGPFTIEELKRLDVKRDTPVWFEGLDDWKLMGDIEELGDLFKVKPPPYRGKKEEDFYTKINFENEKNVNQQESREERTSTSEKIKAENSSEEETNLSKPEDGADRKPKKKKKSLAGRIFKVIGILVVVIVGGFFLFNHFAPDDVKKEFYDAVGVDNPVLTDYTVYVKITGTCNQGVLKKKWHASGLVWSTHLDKAFSQVTVRFHFSDGYEDEIFYKDLSPNNAIQKKPWLASISGHKNAVFEYMEVVDVK